MPVHMVSGHGYDSNVILVTGEHPFLVDTGTGAHSRYVLQEIERIIPGQKLERIVLTHRHYDHVGGVADILKAHGPEVLIHSKDAESVEIADGKSTAADMFGRKLERIKATHLEEGDGVSSGLHEFRVIHTPGHTVGSICLYDDENSILISGDTVFVGGVGRWDLPTGDKGDLERSIKTLSSLRAKDIYPGHGRSGLGIGAEVVQQAMEMLGEF